METPTKWVFKSLFYNTIERLRVGLQKENWNEIQLIEIKFKIKMLFSQIQSIAQRINFNLVKY